ncbi:uncharacterized protein LOC120353868 isoform X1 [Nilaparvata lugens]|uniref:uncharacterized protein LOC120353868 isoform X1 n=1 Tax=Nilaparvata lugens TaxID=108931 RepID=UPI00193CE6DD|nr:uncharacterized protein LOC120353868 isoform X1 [Nilaparvata lugens]
MVMKSFWKTRLEYLSQLFFLNPKGPKVLTRKGDKTVYQKVNADEKECITVLVTGSASGVVAPTTCLFKYKRIPQEIADNYPKEWGLGKTDSGWMTCEAFFEFIADIFHPWFVEKQITLPVILFIDGHASHLSFQTSKFCEENGIILVALLPNATHILQPMDVAVFRSLKEGWKNKVHKWRLENIIKDGSHLLKKNDFAKLLQEVIDENVTESMLSNGFKKCGLYPWNPQIIEVPGQGSFKEQDESDSTELKIQYFKQGLRFLNDMIGKEKLSVFEASTETCCGDPLDTSLFKCWKKTKMELERLELDVRNNIISANLSLNDDAVESPADGNNVDETPPTDIDVIFELSGTEPCDLGNNVSANISLNNAAVEFPDDENNINEACLTDIDVIFNLSETEPFVVGSNTNILLNKDASQSPVDGSNINEVLSPNQDVVLELLPTDLHPEQSTGKEDMQATDVGLSTSPPPPLTGHQNKEYQAHSKDTFSTLNLRTIREEGSEEKEYQQ